MPAADGLTSHRRVLVRDGFVDDTFTFVADDANACGAVAGDVVVSLKRHLASPIGKRGVRLAPSDDARALAGKLDGVALVEVVLPKMSEGRPYTQARILREQLGYRGRIRAIGEVRRDLLFFLFRCGVDEAVLKDPDEEAEAHRALGSFSVLYQGAADVDLPLWKRARR